jgi:hypothetical protein
VPPAKEDWRLSLTRQLFAQILNLFSLLAKAKALTEEGL